MKIAALSWTLMTCVLATVVAHGATLAGTVVEVSDGDSITVEMAGNRLVKVRLHGVDAPELAQPFGERAKEELSSLVMGKAVTLRPLYKDSSRCTRAYVFSSGVPVNFEMVQRGLAWWSPGYAKTAKDLAEAQATARANRAGLWSEPDPVPPWKFRGDEGSPSRRRSSHGRRCAQSWTGSPISMICAGGMLK